MAVLFLKACSWICQTKHESLPNVAERRLLLKKRKNGGNNGHTDVCCIISRRCNLADERNFIWTSRFLFTHVVYRKYPPKIGRKSSSYLITFRISVVIMFYLFFLVFDFRSKQPQQKNCFLTQNYYWIFQWHTEIAMPCKWIKKLALTETFREVTSFSSKFSNAHTSVLFVCYEIIDFTVWGWFKHCLHGLKTVWYIMGGA